MTEILNILFIFIIFLFLTFVPLNVFKTRDINYVESSFFKIKSLNLIINLNIFLLISLLPLTIYQIKNYILLYFLIFFIFLYWKNLFNFLSKNYFYKIVFLFTIFFILAFNILYKLELGWDAQTYYYLKYLNFFQDGVYSELNSYDIQTDHFHPHLGQYLWAFFSRISLDNNEIYGRLFYLFLYCFSLIYLSALFIPKKNILSLISFIFLVLLTYNYELFSGYQEILIFSFLVLVSVNIFNIYNKEKYITNFYECLLIMNILIWTKSEGFVYALILTIIIFFSPIRKKEKLIALFAYILFNLFKFIIFELNEFSSIARPGLYVIDHILNMDITFLIIRIKQTIFWLIYYLMVNEVWIICLICLLFLIFKLKNSTINFNFLYLFFVFDVLFIFISYIFPTIGTEYYIRTTLNREIFSTSGFFIISLVIYGNLLLDKKEINEKQLS